MGDYIDRDAVFHAMKMDIRPPFAVVRDFPAADVAPVVHGKWELKETVHFGLKEYKCSECSDDEYWKKYYCRGNETYCPNCGAKMDKED